ncbi:aldo/keto reductase [Rhizobium mongolense]|uniref:Aryl-alcohol dehydrogenase-like predicted oxidoreductase n=2 Tax=Rhizobium mongolense TaxID=57676 RepID=A0ABR6IKI5_9HYPH|nr:aldo/keto reductase [Rhizobium mongolense]MBB4228245.1 aryl-alcohol dehydrogenase-like predicted oxidoreductase [Rhizobium mongolense]TVZ64608.1 aryl-alcohol dehydrogenase-like predicted oxidoreductase [Rhizobium mongolense USDA 1844]
MLTKTDNATTITLWNGREVPRLGMGCWAIGGPFFAGDVPLGWGEVDDDESIEAIHRAVDLGIRFFDTASNYGAGHSEEVVGRAIGNRDDIVIATKFGFATDEKTKQATGAFADPAFIRKSAETSLRRLKRDRLDLLQFHLNDFPLEASDDVFDVLEALKAEGKIDAFGWSTDFPDRAARHAGCKGFVSIQHTMNVFEPVPAMVDVIEKNGLLSINRGPLAMGLLSGKFTPEKTVGATDVRATSLDWMVYFKDGRIAPEFAARLEAVRDLLATGGRTLTQGALAWLWARSPRTLPIPGFRTVAQVEENAGALEKGPLPRDVMARIDAALAGR